MLHEAARSLAERNGRSATPRKSAIYQPPKAPRFPREEGAASQGGEWNFLSTEMLSAVMVLHSFTEPSLRKNTSHRKPQNELLFTGSASVALRLRQV